MGGKEQRECEKSCAAHRHLVNYFVVLQFLLEIDRMLDK